MNYYLIHLEMEDKSKAILPLIVMDSSVEEAINYQLEVLSLKGKIIDKEMITKDHYENLLKFSNS